MVENVKKFDKGANGKKWEIAVHTYCVRKPREYGVTPNNTGRADFKVKSGNKFLQVEVKSGAGVLLYNTDCQTLDEAVDAIIAAKWDYMVYIPSYVDGMVVGKNGFVMSKQDFVDFMLSYSAPIIRFKNNTQGYRDVTLQEFNSNKKQDYLWDFMSTMPTVDTWLEQVRA
jgi:hypothetical protein